MTNSSLAMTIHQENWSATQMKAIDWETWLSDHGSLLGWLAADKNRRLGIQTSGEINLFELGAAIKELGHLLSHIDMSVETFTDGRVFSIGRSLRQRYGFKGELVVRGDILIDQVEMLKLCGFNEVFDEAGQKLDSHHPSVHAGRAFHDY